MYKDILWYKVACMSCRDGPSPWRAAWPGRWATRKQPGSSQEAAKKQRSIIGKLAGARDFIVRRFAGPAINVIKASSQPIRGSQVPAAIRHPKDFWTGIIYLCIGLYAVAIGQDYAMGSAGRMGPAYFPTLLGSLLALIGAVAVGRSFFRRGERISRFYVKELVLVLVAVLLFGFLVRGAGLVPATLLIVMTSAYASARFRFGKTVLLAAGLALFGVLLFVKLLGLPMPILGPWLGFN